MITKKVTFEGLDGSKQEREFTFHIAKQELIELDASYGPKGLEGELLRIETEEDTVGMYFLFTRLINMSYGVIREDDVIGQYFDKNLEQTGRFTQSPAYEALFMSIVKDVESAKKFFNGVASIDIV